MNKEALSFEERSDGTLEAKIISAEEEIIIPEYHGDKKITRVSTGEIQGVEKIKRVKLPIGVKEIAPSAFSGFSSLRDINIPEGACSVGGSAFYGCHSLRSVILPATLEVMEGVILGDCPSLIEICVDRDNPVFCSVDGNLYTKDKSKLILYAKGKEERELVIPEDTVEIAEYAFSGVRRLEKIKIGKSLTKIGSNAFTRCLSLKEIEVDAENAAYSSLSGNLYNKDKSVLIQYAVGKEDISFSVPDTVKIIDEGAFTDAKRLVEVILPPSVREISHYAFFGCKSLAKLHGGKGLSYIGESAFEDCESLIEIKIPKAVEYIEYFAFSGCSSLTILAECEEMPPDWYFGIENDVAEIIFSAEV